VSDPFRILTVTWSADLEHFALLRDSLASSRLGDIAHDVVVQTEDLPLFQEYARYPVSLYATKDVLPSAVEAKRLQARRWQGRTGRTVTKLLGSLARHSGRPNWVRYTGWHTQQLCKLAHVASSATHGFVLMDSDVVVTPLAEPEDFVTPGRILCFSHWKNVDSLNGKMKNWQSTARQLFDGQASEIGRFDSYTDTPFVLDAPIVRDMMQWLEQRYSMPWWQVLLSLPPRRWSEFCIYKTYLRDVSTATVEWQDVDKFGYLFEAGDPEALAREFSRQIESEQRHYITIHSQSSGRQLWSAASYAGHIRQCLAAQRP